MKYLKINIERLRENKIYFCPGDLIDGEIVIEDRKCQDVESCEVCRDAFYDRCALETTSTNPAYNEGESFCPTGETE